MNTRGRFVSIAGIVAIAFALGTAGAQGKKEVTFVDSKNAQFKEVVPGVKKTLLWGDDNTGPYGAFTKFDPGLTNPLHTHAVKIVVIRGAYLFKPQNGKFDLNVVKK